MSFCYGSESLEYHLVLEERKTIAATVFPSCELLVKAPADATVEGIEAFLTGKLRWVLKQKRYFAGFNQSAGKQYLSGETFRYRGRSYKLLLHGNCGRGRVSLQHGVLNVFIEGDKSPDSAKHLVEKWYTESAARVFPERVRVCAALFGLHQTPEVVQRRMNRRWGSYSKKRNRVTLIWLDQSRGDRLFLFLPFSQGTSSWCQSIDGLIILISAGWLPHFINSSGVTSLLYRAYRYFCAQSVAEGFPYLMITPTADPFIVYSVRLPR